MVQLDIVTIKRFTADGRCPSRAVAITLDHCRGKTKIGYRTSSWNHPFWPLQLHIHNVSKRFCSVYHHHMSNLKIVWNVILYTVVRALSKRVWNVIFYTTCLLLDVSNVCRSLVNHSPHKSLMNQLCLSTDIY